MKMGHHEHQITAKGRIDYRMHIKTPAVSSMKLRLITLNTLVMFNILFVLLVAIPVSSADWVEYWKDHQGNLFSYDRDSIKYKTAEIVQVRDRMDHLGNGADYSRSERQDKMHPPDNKKFAYMISLIEIHCVQAKYQIVEFSDFDMEGDLIATGSFENDWIHIRPETFAAELKRLICK